MIHKKIIVCASGYFDPIHSGHINYLKEAKKLGGKLIVILNNDFQSKLKKKHYFMPLNERKKILEAIRYVDGVFVSIDKTRDVGSSLRKLKPDIFAVGTDNIEEKLAEKKVCDELGIKIVDKLAKTFFKQSSSKIIHNYLKARKLVEEI